MKYKKSLAASFRKKWERRLGNGNATISIAEIPARLSDLSVDLGATCQSVESRFIQLGRELQSVHTDAGKLTEHTLGTVKRIGGDSEGGVLTGIKTLVDGSLTRLKTGQVEVTANLSQINRNAQHLGDLQRMSAEAEKIGMFLRVIGLNIGIESARSDESREKFASVSQEIRELSKKVVDVAQCIRGDSEAAQTGQISAHGSISENSARLQKLSDDARQTVQGTLRRIEHLMQLALEALQRAGSQARKVSHQVGEIVMGIQFHDNLNQRIQHIIKAFGDAGDICTEAESAAASPKSKKRELAAAHSIVAIQDAQLKQAITEIDGVYRRSRTAFETIADEIGRLADNLSSFGQDTTQAGSDPKASTEDPFTPLKSALINLNRLLDQSAELADRIQGTTTHASEATTQLLGYIKHVRGFSQETHVKALNAIVNAAHLGHAGKTLEILAQEIKILSDRTTGFVDDVSAVLKSISDISVKPETGEPQGAEGPGPASSDSSKGGALNVGIQDITCAYDRFRVESREAVERAGVLKTVISQSKSSLEFLPALAGKLTQHLGQLEKIELALNPWAAGDGGDLTMEAGKLSQRYTMQKERDIHEHLVDVRVEDTRVAAPRNIGNEAVKKETPPAGEMVGLEDNIELFSDETDQNSDTNVELFSSPDDLPDTPIDPAAIRAPNTDGNLQDDNCELFDSQEITSARDVAAKEIQDEDDLGDNIDLF